MYVDIPRCVRMPFLMRVRFVYPDKLFSTCKAPRAAGGSARCMFYVSAHGGGGGGIINRADRVAFKRGVRDRWVGAYGVHVCAFD